MDNRPKKPGPAPESRGGREARSLPGLILQMNSKDAGLTVLDLTCPQ